MKPKILFIINDYLNHNSPDNICINKILENIHSDYSIDIATIGRNNINDKNNKLYNIFILDKDLFIDRSILEYIVKFKNYKYLYFILYNTIKFVFRIIKCVFWPDLSIIHFKSFKNLCEKLILKNQYCCIITVSGLFTSQLIGLSLKKYNIIWFSYQYDPLPKYNFIYKYYLFRFLSNYLSNKIEKKCDNYFTLLPIGFYNKINKNKYIEIGIPFLENTIPKNKINLQNNKINLLFVGTLNNKVRKTDILLKLINNSKFKNKILVTIIGDNIDKTKKSNNLESNFLFLGKLPHEKVLEYYKYDYILINIGNENSFQLPSKTIEYISTGLPIVSIDKNENITKKIFDYYKNSEVIISKKYNSNIQKKFDDFISKPFNIYDVNYVIDKLEVHSIEFNIKSLKNSISKYYFK